MSMNYTATEIKKAIMDYLMARVDSNNYGILSTYKVSNTSFKVCLENKVYFKGDTVYVNEQPTYKVQCRYGKWKELKPTLIKL